MNRELKFRAWDKRTKHMIETGFHMFGEVMAFDMVYDYCMQHKNEDEPGLLRMNDVVVMQYTGLKDKNDKAIYEGDILGGAWSEGWIAYCDKCKSFEYFVIDFGCCNCEGDVSWSEIVVDDGQIEVVGNIYENPELLENKGEKTK